MPTQKDDKKPIRILVADDHPMMRRGMVDLLRSEPGLEVVAEAEDGQTALELCRELRPDVVITDLDMPRMDGLEATRRITAELPESRVIVLTVHAGEDDVARCLQAGARGYLLKKSKAEEILQTIRAVHGGRRRVDPELSEKLAEHMGAPALTAREMDVLRAMAEGKDNQTIAAQLGITEGTTKWYVTSIFSKLDVTDRTQAVVQAVKRGLVRIGS